MLEKRRFFMRHQFRIQILAGIFLCSSFLAGCATTSSNGAWWETGMISSYPRSTYLTASGFGSSVDRAKSDALKNLSGIIRSKVKSKSVSIRTESDSTQHFLRREHLDVSTDAVLKGVYFPKVKFDSHQNGYYALAVLNRKKAAQSLSSDLSSLKLRILSKKTQMEGAPDPVHQARLLVRIIELEKRAVKKSQELSGLSDIHPILGFSISDDSEKLMNLFSKDLTFEVHITGDPSGTSVLTDQITELLGEDGFRPATGTPSILIQGDIHTGQVPAPPGSPYVFIGFNSAIAVVDVNRRQTVQTLLKSGRDAGNDLSQAERLLEGRLKRSVSKPVVRTVEDYILHPERLVH
jgi:hypothetical protein